VTGIVKRIKISGAELNVVDRGQGPPILFVHGFPLSHSMWQAQLNELEDDFRVIAPDLRGFGQSSMANGTVTMDQFADDLNALIDALDVREPISFCGHSMGGYIAWQFVQKYSKRLRSLILCNTRAVADTVEVAERRRKLAVRVIQQGPKVVATALISRLFAESTIKRRSEVIQSVRDMIHSTEPRSIAVVLHGMAERPDSRDILSRIKVPTLVVVGEQDIIATATEMKQIAESIDQSEFVVIAESGHMSPMEMPNPVNSAIRRFLNRH